MDRMLDAFLGLVNGYLSGTGEPVAGPGCFIETDGVLLQLLLVPERAEVAFCAAIFDGLGDPAYLVPEVIADFNAVQFFDGGYCLLVEETYSGLYVSQRRALDALGPATLGDLLRDLAGRARQWRRWYREAARDFWPKTPEPAAARP